MKSLMIFIFMIITIAKLHNSQYTSFNKPMLTDLPDEGVMIDVDPKNAFFAYVKYENGSYAAQGNNLNNFGRPKELSDLTHTFTSSDDQRTISRLKVTYVLPALKSLWNANRNVPNVINGFTLYLNETPIGYKYFYYKFDSNEYREETENVVISGTVFNIPSNIYKVSLRINTNLPTFQWATQRTSAHIYLEGEYMAEGVKENKNFILPYVEKAPFFNLVKLNNMQNLNFEWDPLQKNTGITIDSKNPARAIATTQGHKSVIGKIEMRDHIYYWTQTYESMTNNPNGACWWIFAGVASKTNIAAYASVPTYYHTFWYGWNWGIGANRMQWLNGTPNNPCKGGPKSGSIIDVELNFPEDTLIMKERDGTTYVSNTSVRNEQPLVHTVELYNNDNGITISNFRKINVN